MGLAFLIRNALFGSAGTLGIAKKICESGIRYPLSSPLNVFWFCHTFLFTDDPLNTSVVAENIEETPYTEELKTEEFGEVCWLFLRE